MATRLQLENLLLHTQETFALLEGFGGPMPSRCKKRIMLRPVSNSTRWWNDLQVRKEIVDRGHVPMLGIPRAEPERGRNLVIVDQDSAHLSARVSDEVDLLHLGSRLLLVPGSMNGTSRTRWCLLAPFTGGWDWS